MSAIIFLLWFTILFGVVFATEQLVHAKDGQVYTKDSERIGSVRQTSKDRYIILDKYKNHTGTIRVKPSGRVNIYNSQEQRTHEVTTPQPQRTR